MYTHLRPCHAAVTDTGQRRVAEAAAKRHTTTKSEIRPAHQQGQHNTEAPTPPHRQPTRHRARRHTDLDRYIMRRPARTGDAYIYSYSQHLPNPGLHADGYIYIRL